MAAADLRAHGERLAPGAWLELDRITVECMSVRVGRMWPEGRPRGTVVILTGRAEFLEKYRETVVELADAGYAVASFDWRGQGGSDRFTGFLRQGHVTRVDDYLADLAAVLDHLDRQHMPRPWLMLAHSMGAHVGLRFLAEGSPRFAGAALTAPMFGINLRPLPDSVAQAICRFAIRLGAGARYALGQRDFDPARLAFLRNKLTTCDVRFADFKQLVEATPELIVGGVTYSWLAASLASIARTREPGYVEAIEVPVLVCQAGDERVVSNRAITRLTRRLPRGRLRVFRHGRHELLRERDPVRREVVDAILGFFAELAPTSRVSG